MKAVNSFFTFTHEEIDSGEVANWKEIGFNAASTYIFDPQKHNKANFIKTLDLCAENKIKVLISDERVGVPDFKAFNEKEYRRGVENAVSDFGSHPAFLGFFMADELPYKSRGEDMIKANLLVLDYCDKTNFINFFPYVESEDYEKTQGIRPSQTEAALSEIITKGKYKIWGTDYYEALAIRGNENGMRQYFKNLNMCSRVSKKTGTDCWFGLLCFGYANIACPTMETIRWQQSSVFMHGLSGANWYKLYDKNVKGYSSLSTGCDSRFPINMYGDKTETYTYLKHTVRVFNDKFKDKFEQLEHIKTWHYMHGYADTEQYFEDDDDILIRVKSAHGENAVITRFKNTQTGKPVYAIMNLSQSMPERYNFKFNNEYEKRSGGFWLKAGEMALIEL